MFAIALGGSAFTRISKASTSYDGATMYYQDGYGSCESMYVIDANCVSTELSYICYEDTTDEGWQVMLQNEVGATCYNPYYSYYPND